MSGGLSIFIKLIVPTLQMVVKPHHSVMHNSIGNKDIAERRIKETKRISDNDIAILRVYIGVMS